MRRYLILFLCLLLPGAMLGAAASPQLQMLIEQSQFVDAARSGEKWLLQNPQDTEARFLTAYAYQMSGKPDQAILLYEAVIRDNPTLPEPRNNLAMIYLDRGDYDHASQLLVEAINTQSSYATAYANLSLVYKGIASEAYRRAVSESSEPENYRHEIKLTAITSLEPLAAGSPALPQVAMQTKPATEPVAAQPAAPEPASSAPTPVNTTNLQTLLIERVHNWAEAWSGKQFDAYTAAYTSEYRDKFDTHEKWVQHRRGRIMRPGEIKVVVSDFTIKQRGDKRASVDFVQAFSSPSYSDRVVKRLYFDRVGSQWKIADEKVISVL
jgi:tetratricopeptide (TPR) repeat protein